METVQLYGRGGEVKERLPKVCMVCGEPATLRKEKQFTWQPQWVHALIIAGVVPYLIVLVILQKKMKVRIPLCEKHKSPWFWYCVSQTFTILSLIGGLIGAVVLGIMLDDSDFGWLICPFMLVGGLGLLVMLIGSEMLGKQAPHPKEITDKTITLAAVSDAFYEAFMEDEGARGRDEEDEEEDDAPRRRRSRRDD